MSQAVFEAALKFVLHWEGGFSADPDDLGGATNRGITQATYDAWRKAHGLPLQSVAKISTDEVRTIYQHQYWQPSFAYINDYPLAVVLFDTAVQFGPYTYKQFLSAALGMPKYNRLHHAFHTFKVNFLGEPSHYMTQDMLAKLVQCDQKEIAARVVQKRRDFRLERVRKNPSQKKFLKGWQRRDNSLEEQVKLGPHTVRCSPTLCEPDKRLHFSCHAVVGWR